MTTVDKTAGDDVDITVVPDRLKPYIAHLAAPAENGQQHCARCGTLLEPDLAGRPGWHTGELVLRVRATGESRLPGDPGYLVMTHEWLDQLACEPKPDASTGGTSV